MAIAFVFPGQGSQEVGMGADLAARYPAAKAVFDEVDEALGEKLSELIWNGPKDTLTLTQNAQPALMAMSLAVIRVLEAERGLSLEDRVSYVAGHSLGEYSALAAAKALSVGEAAKLLRIRGQAMQAAVPVNEGGMVALLGIGITAAEALAAEAAGSDVCEIANDNEPMQVVVSGHATAMGRVLEIAKSHGARRALPLPVSAPFHCSLMQPAADAMATALGDIALRKPVVPVFANVVAAPVEEPEEIGQRLIEQVTGTVRWRESVANMVAAGVDDFYEIGAGKVLAGLIKRIASDVRATSIGRPDDIETLGTEILG